jgi:hypothetical protein
MALKSDITLDALLFASSSIPADTSAFNNKLVQIMSTGRNGMRYLSFSYFVYPHKFPLANISLTIFRSVPQSIGKCEPRARHRCPRQPI